MPKQEFKKTNCLIYLAVKKAIETWSVYKVLCKGKFHRKVCCIFAPETSLRPPFNFGK